MKVMPKYMVIFNWMSDYEDQETTARFYGTYEEAENARMNAVCGLGAYAEVYIREEVFDDNGDCVGTEYTLLYS